MTPDALLAEFRRQVRLADADRNLTHLTERIGLVRRSYPADPTDPGAMIESPDGLGDTEDEIAAAIATEVAFFTDRGQRVEWKTYADDAPADLVSRLAAAGFAVGDVEVLMLGRAADLVPICADPLPPGLGLREFSGAVDWARASALMDTVWGVKDNWVNDVLRREQEAAPERFRPVFVEETAGARRVVSYAALRLTPGVDFAGLWGGSTHPDYRGRGLYRALTAYRAQLALAAGHPYVRVDTSPDSRPILTRLGLHPVTTTTPCVLEVPPMPDTGPGRRTTA